MKLRALVLFCAILSIGLLNTTTALAQVITKGLDPAESSVFDVPVADREEIEAQRIVTATPTVTYPAWAGIQWELGTTHSISWSGFPAGNVKIELYRGTAFNRTILASTPNNGTYRWLIPTNLSPGQEYRIKITSLSNQLKSDISDQYFAIVLPFPRVTFPDSTGTCWYRGTSHRISWANFPGSNVKIELYQGGYFRRIISASATNNGSFMWAIPADLNPATNYRIKITSLSDSTKSDMSNGYLAIAGSDPTVFHPSSPGIKWTRGINRWIGWKRFTGSLVKIELFKGEKLVRMISHSTANDGYHAWLVPATHEIGDNYKVKVTSLSNKSNFDLSDNPINIVKVSPPKPIPTKNACTHWHKNTNPDSDTEGDGYKNTHSN